LKDTYDIEPKSQTDTEICSIFVGVFLDKGFSLNDAISETVKILEGAYSFVLISILDLEAMYIVKNTGTMVIGFPNDLAQTDSKGKLDRRKSISSLSIDASAEETTESK